MEKRIVFGFLDDLLMELHLREDSWTNENRENIVDSMYALFRTDKAVIDKITNKNTDEHLDNIYYYGKQYKIGDIIALDNINKDPNLVYGKGIHYYLNKEPAMRAECYLPNNFTGIDICWYSNGGLKYEIPYNNGKIHGKTRIWHCSGKSQSVEEESEYNDGHLIKKTKYNKHTDDENSHMGCIESTEEWENGKLMYVKKYYKLRMREERYTYYNGNKMCRIISIYPNDTVEYQYFELNNRNHGLFTRYYKYSENKESEVNFVDGEKHGIETWWYHDKSMKMTLQFCHGELHGKRIDWDIYGYEWIIGEWVNGAKEGIHEGRDKFGHKISEGNWINGMEDGIHIEWMRVEDDPPHYIVVKEGNWINGKKDGIHKEFEKENNKYIVSTWKQGEEITEEIDKT
jgi:antitoxin component YwqK of YwqJK toxin-antitoxin module